MTELRCTLCGSTTMQEGFVEDSGQAARGFARWVAGPLERGLLGGAKLFGKHRLQIHAFRCANCTHLELFAYND
ncbi:hypothetical protein E1264_37370 [Actinomadura sp. KC216]|uniref:hypothetical protein n=1 Tax=Actinomadura sp. KC216 TaxID=2530370 RepID=UPI001047794A|nr:hypothetical protein [Actinomadura sp. KC216]TDB77615.1 hypothetical protein E1264_37370 [Actinomadura sp. KC216]